MLREGIGAFLAVAIATAEMTAGLALAPWERARHRISREPHLDAGQGVRLAVPSALAWAHGRSVASKMPERRRMAANTPPFTDRALFQAPDRRPPATNRTPLIPTDANLSESAAFLLVGETGFELDQAGFSNRAKAHAL